MKREFLLGITGENSLVFAEVEYSDNASNPHFSVCFREVEPFKLDMDKIKNNIEDMLEYEYTKEDLYVLCERYDCSPSQLLNEYMENHNDEDLIDMVYDTSLYTEQYQVQGDLIYFQSLSSGQHDTRDYLKVYPHGEGFADFIFAIWDKYHLKELSEKQQKEIFNTIDSILIIDNLNEESYIQNWLENLSDEGLFD